MSKTTTKYDMYNVFYITDIFRKFITLTYKIQKNNKAK